MQTIIVAKTNVSIVCVRRGSPTFHPHARVSKRPSPRHPNSLLCRLWLRDPSFSLCLSRHLVAHLLEEACNSRGQFPRA